MNISHMNFTLIQKLDHNTKSYHILLHEFYAEFYVIMKRNFCYLDFTAWFNHFCESSQGTERSVGHLGHGHELPVVTAGGGQAVQGGQQERQAGQRIV